MKQFMLTEEHAMLRDLARDLARAELKIRSEEVDHQAKAPREGLSIFAEAGLLCCTVPEIYGGAELDSWSQTAVIEEAAKECGSTAFAMAEAAAVAECVLRHGSEAQKQAILPALVQGGFAAVVGKGAGEKNGLISGESRFVPLAGACAWYLAAVAAGDETRWYVIQGGAEGLRAEAEAAALGLKGCPAGKLVFESCKAEALTGDVQKTLTAVRALYSAAVSAGVAEGALSEAIAYVNQRIQFGKTISQFENTQQVLAELLAKAEAARALVWEAAHVKDGGEADGCMAAMAKVVASDFASIITRKCVQFMGGYGYSREYPVERKMRDAKMLELLGGSAEDLKTDLAYRLVVQ